MSADQHPPRTRSEFGTRVGEEWLEPFRRVLDLHGRPADKHKWDIGWARKFAMRIGGGTVREATRKDVEEFLSHALHLSRDCPMADGPGCGLPEDTHRERIRSRVGAGLPVRSPEDA
jgi:hypothetical protein